MKFLITKKFHVTLLYFGRFDEVSNCKKVYVKVADRCMVLFMSLDTFLGCVNVIGICCCCCCWRFLLLLFAIAVAVADDHTLVCVLM